jgi:hypothetical protein
VTRIAAACAAALFVPLLVPLAIGRVLTMDDLAFFHVPVRLLYARALAAGDMFTWTPDLGSGFYLHGEGQAGMFHPLHLLLYASLPFEPAFNLEIIASYAWMLIGTRLMLGRMRLSPAACWFGAMAFTFSGFNLMRLLHVNAIAVIAHLPWLILTADHVIAPLRPRRRVAAAAAFALLVGSMLLLGYPQFVFLSGVAVIAYALWRTAAAPAWRAIAWLAFAFACGVGIGAAQVLPTRDLMSVSERGDPSIGFVLTYSLHPMNLVQLVAPYVFRRRAYMLPDELSIHEMIVYTGAFCTLAAAWSIVRWRELPHRALAVWASTLAAFSLVLALGRYAGLYYVIASLPVVGWFRAPSRFVLLLHFALAILAAIVFDDLLQLVGARRRALPPKTLAALAIPVAASAAITAVALFVTGRGAVRGAESLTAMAATAILIAWSARGNRIALALIPVVFAIDLGMWGYRYAWQEPPASVNEIARRADVPTGSPGELVYTPRKSNMPVLAGYRVANPYVALVPLRLLDPGDRIVQRLAGVAWRRAPNGWERVEAPMPRVRLLSEARVSTDVKRDIQTIDIERTALVPEPVAIEAGSAGEARILVDRPGRIMVETRADGRRMLVTTERYYRGWEARVNGYSTPPLRVNGDFLGCMVDSGTWTVTLTFAPLSLRLGKWISLGWVVVALSLLVYGMRTSREKVALRERDGSIS